MHWQVVDYEFEGDTLWVILTDGGYTLELMADVILNGPAAIIRGLHVQGSGAHSLGLQRLIGLKNWAKDFLGVDELHVEGAIRTSGANPGRLPPPVVGR